jgi:hypothetical protein
MKKYSVERDKAAMLATLDDIYLDDEPLEKKTTTTSNTAHIIAPISSPHRSNQ